jgi:type IV secretory pathway VirB2 component (pilin)
MTVTLPALSLALLQLPMPEGPIGKALIAVIAIGVVILVGRVVLSIAWKLVLIASVLIGALWLVTTFLG